MTLKDIFEDFSRVYSRHKLVAKYFSTGILASMIDIGLLYLIKEYFNLWYLTSAIISLILSLVLVFIVHKYWTFRDFSGHNLHGQFLGYISTVLFCIVLNLVLLTSLVEFSHINYILAQLISLCISGVFGFVLNVRNVFSDPIYPTGVLIAAGIFPPDIGGPASQIKRLAISFLDRGENVSVVTYSAIFGHLLDDDLDVTRIPIGWPIFVRGPLYLFSLFLSSINYPNIFAQDITATGIPASIIKRLLPQKKLVIRIGGDLLWERKTESGHTALSIVGYYLSGAHKNEKLFKIGRRVMSIADEIVVPAEFLKEIYVRYYGVPSEKIIVIKNVFPEIRLTSYSGEAVHGGEHTVLFAGRFLKLKNVERLIRAFCNIYEEIKPARLVLIGDGPEKENYQKVINASTLKNRIVIMRTMDQEKLFSEISASNLCVCPSFSEVNSNFTLECLALGRPVLSTRNNGLSVKLPEEMLFSYDDQIELQNKMKALLAGRYDKQRIEEILKEEMKENSWQNLVSKYRDIFNLK